MNKFIFIIRYFLTLLLREKHMQIAIVIARPDEMKNTASDIAVFSDAL